MTAKDRSGRIKAMGVLQLMLGGFSLLLAVLVLLGALLSLAVAGESWAASVTVPSVVSSVSILFLGGGFFVLVGIGSIRLKRWVRPLVLSLMWPALIVGVLDFGLSIYLIPMLFDAVTLAGGAEGAGLPGTVVSVVVFVSLSMIFIVGIVVPGAQVLLYQGAAVKQTLEERDPEPGFVDRCPAPVFGLAVGFVLCGLLQLSLIGYGVAPFFGVLLTGAAAVGALLAELALSLVVAVFVYRGSLRGFWAGLGYLGFLYAKYAVAFLIVALPDFYLASGVLSQPETELMERLFEGLPIAWIAQIIWLLSAGAAALYMWGIKRHFR